jgi:hypothetical protein
MGFVQVGVMVEGRPGVGRRTIETALRRRGVHVVTRSADVRVLVVAEVVKPEDVVDEATVVVQTKADLTETTCGVRVVGLLALVDRLDDAEVDALRVLVENPADMTSVDAFVACAHPLGREVRQRLLERLDRFGVAHAVLALSAGAEPSEVAARLRALSNIDAVLTGIDALTASVRYRRISESTCRADVFERMTAAVAVVEAAGVPVDRGNRPADHRRRALHWARYARGPVTDLHRACAADIVRGSLRLLDGAVP